MNDILYITMLYDFYGELLTAKQKAAVESCCLNDMSLNEASFQYGITKQAMGDLLNRTVAVLKKYEQKLKLYEKYIEQKNTVDAISRSLDEAIAKDGCNPVNFCKVKKMLSEMKNSI